MCKLSRRIWHLLEHLPKKHYNEAFNLLSDLWVCWIESKTELVEKEIQFSQRTRSVLGNASVAELLRELRSRLVNKSKQVIGLIE